MTSQPKTNLSSIRVLHRHAKELDRAGKRFANEIFWFADYFGERDPMLAAQLRAEAAGILERSKQTLSSAERLAERLNRESAQGL
ncbi:MAG TPA: hypothetical protein VKU87_00080 [Thermomicrobiaceae bacterium]|nr:hypothetical protein [Thermomicrobiaceae bacterium]